MYKVLLFAATFVALLASSAVYGNKCYGCNSISSESCSKDPFNVTADGVSQPECGDRGCAKIIVSGANITNMVMRECGKGDTGISCTSTTSADGLTTNSCYCPTELCNTAVSVKGLGFITLLSASALLSAVN